MCLSEYSLYICRSVFVNLASDIDDVVSKLDPLVILAPEELAHGIVAALALVLIISGKPIVVHISDGDILKHGLGSQLDCRQSEVEVPSVC